MTIELANNGRCLIDGVEESEPGNAQRLVHATGGLYKYAPKIKAWMVYEGGKWVVDEEGIRLLAMAKKVTQTMFLSAAAGIENSGSEPQTPTKKVDARTKVESYTPAQKEQAAQFAKEQAAHAEWQKGAEPYLELSAWATKSSTESQLRHMISLAKDIKGVTIDYEAMDPDPSLVNFTNGTFNVGTTCMQPHDPLNLITKQCPVDYVPNATCPLWDKFLSEVQPDPYVRAFLQRIAGSALTGDALENLFLNVGGGANGKDTFWGRIQKVAGSYGVEATETMVIDNGQNQTHDEDLARLRGARLLMLPETNAGDKLNTARINNMTGGGIIRGRHLYGKPFDFMQTHTALMHTNHKPRINETTNGIWRRVIQIPWDVQIPEDRRDLDLKDKLDRTELEGIAAWIMRGAVAWRKEKLNTPPSIRLASEKYRQEQDTIGRFLHECWGGLAHGMMSPLKGSVLTSTFRTAYVDWCKMEGIREQTAKTVGDYLTEHGYRMDRRRIGNDNPRIWTEPNLDTSTDVDGTDNSLTRTVPSVPSQTLMLNLEKGNTSEDVYVDSEKDINGSGGTLGTPQVTALDLEPSQEELEEWNWDKVERAYLTERGFPVPPTEAEIAKHFQDVADGMYAEDEDRFKPDWVE